MDIHETALTYTNNDYGKGLADSIAANVEMRGRRRDRSIAARSKDHVMAVANAPGEQIFPG